MAEWREDLDAQHKWSGASDWQKQRDEEAGVEILNLQPEEAGLHVSPLDCRFWEATRERQDTARSVFESRGAAVVGLDLFASLFKAKPEIKGEPLEPIRAAAMEFVMGCSDYMQLHQSTMMDEQLSAGGAIRMVEHFNEYEKTKGLFDKLAEAEGLRQEQEKGEDQGAGNSGGGDEESDEGEGDDDSGEDQGEGEGEGEGAGGGEGGQPSPQAPKPKPKSREKEIKDRQKELKKEVEKMMGDKKVQSEVRQAVEDTNDDVETAEAMSSMGWGTESGNPSDILLDPKMMAAVRRSNFKEMLKLAGKFTEIVSGIRAKRPMPTPSDMKVGTGRDIGKMLPQELAMAVDDDLEWLFLAKFAEGTCQQYEHNGKPKQGKGPFVVCIDESGSMSGQPIQWAKALAMAIGMQAAKEHRNFAAIAFNANPNQMRKVVEPTPREFLEWMGVFLSGGTDFQHPIEAAMQIIEADLPTADIIFITDGECRLSEEFTIELAKRKADMDVRILGLEIGGYGSSTLQPFCERSYVMNPRNGVKGIEAVIEEMK